MKNNLPFFSHDNDAYDHAKHRALRARFGWEGYGRFWALNELIAQAEGCQLDIQRPINRAKVADEMGLSDSDFADFVAFLADPEVCGLVNMLDGILTTDRTQEDFAKVDAKRQRDREHIQRQRRDSRGRVVGEKNNVAGDNQEIASDATAEQIREEQIRQAAGGDTAAAAFPCPGKRGEEPPENHADLRDTLLKAAPAQLAISDQLVQDLGARLAFEGLDLGYVRWFGDYVRRQPKLENPAGYFRAHFGELGEQYRATCRPAATVAAPAGSQEPDNPKAVDQLLGELPWKPGGKRKHAPAPAAGEELPAFE